MTETIEERNTRLTREVMRALENKDADTYERILSPDAKVWLSGDIIGSRTTGNGADQHKAFRDVVVNSPQKWRYNILETTAQDERVSVRLMCMTRMPSGKLYDQIFHFLLKFGEDGTIKEWYEHGDTEMITWALWDGNKPYPPLDDDFRINRFLEARKAWPQGDDAVEVTADDFAWEPSA